MEPVLAHFSNGQKFMWDGLKYDTEGAAREKCKAYQEKGFETLMSESDGTFLVYNRRVVIEVVVEGAPPI